MSEQRQARVHTHTHMLKHTHFGKRQTKQCVSPQDAAGLHGPQKPGRMLKTAWCLPSLSSLPLSTAAHTAPSVPKPGSVAHAVHSDSGPNSSKCGCAILR